MPRYLVSAAFSLHVEIDAESEEAITIDDVEDALMDQYGKYAEIDVRGGGDHFDILDEVEV